MTIKIVICLKCTCWFDKENHCLWSSSCSFGQSNKISGHNLRLAILHVMDEACQSVSQVKVRQTVSTYLATYGQNREKEIYPFIAEKCLYILLLCSRAWFTNRTKFEVSQSVSQSGLEALFLYLDLSSLSYLI